MAVTTPSETGLQKALDAGVAEGRIIAVCSSCKRPIASANHIFRLCPNCGPFGRDTCEPRYYYAGATTPAGDPADYTRT